MIDAMNVTDYNRTPDQLERFLMFCCAVAGKNALTTDKAFDRLVTWVEDNSEIHDRGTLLEWWGALCETKLATPERLKSFGFGCYNHRYKTFYSLYKAKCEGFNFAFASTDDLETLPGIGMKTSRYFILHSRKNVPLAVLDRHVLRYLGEIGVENVPESTPTKPSEYLRLEKEFLKTVPRGKTPAQHDIDIWKLYRAE